MLVGESFLRLVVLTIFSLYHVKTIKWLGLHRHTRYGFNRTQHCTKSRRHGLIANHVKFCKENMEMMPTIRHASFLAVDACQGEFSNWRWNCSSTILAPKLTKDLKSGTREQAFVYAITSSALVHSIARACSLGVTHKCSCGALPNRRPDGDYKWGGCGDDIRYGLSFSETFTNASLIKKGKPKRGKKAAMNRHNHAVGRNVVADSMTIACKCHGVSGSCAVKTCWRSLPSFKTISSSLKKQHAKAVEVGYRRIKRTKQLIPLRRPNLLIGDKELVYLKNSPDYCRSDPKTGSMGTKGRYCKKGDPKRGGCGSMCCGRGFYSFKLTIVERCECKYYWCCYVKCNKCKRTLNLNKCR